MRLRPSSSSDLLLVLVSVFIAFMIWLIAKQADVETQTLAVPVVTDEVPINIIVRVLPERIPVTFQYPKSQENQLLPSNFRITIRVNWEELAGVEDFEKYTHPLEIADVDLGGVAPTIKPIRLSERRTCQLFVKFITAKAVVKPRVTGNPAEGYHLDGSPAAEPADLTITGAQATLNRLTDNGKQTLELETEPVDVAGMSRSDLVKTKVIFLDGVKPAIRENEKVAVSISIREELEERVFEKVTITIKALSATLEARYSPEETSVRVKGPRSVMDRLKTKSFVIAPVQPIFDENIGPETKVAIEAKFDTAEDAMAREKVSILSVEPNVVSLRYVEKKN